MTTDDIKRLYYYEKQFLRPRDFQDEQAYHIEMRRRHNIAHHTWGIVTGLELEEVEGTDEVNIYVKPGMAVDGFGREIFVLQPYKLSIEDGFKSFNTKQYLEVWISYNQELADRPPTGYELCNVKDQFIRLRENFKIKVGPQSLPHDAVVVAGEAKTPPDIPSDESIPYQELPDDENRPRWLIRLGSVNWDGANQKFVKADPQSRLLEERHYVGNITAEVLAPDGKLLIRDRTSNSPLETSETGAAVTLEGSLDVERLLTAKQGMHILGNTGIGATSPGEKLQVDAGSIFVNGEGQGIIVDASGKKRVGFMKYAGREAGIWRIAGQDFEIGRVEDIKLGTNPIVDIYVSGDGKVGIGMTSPAQRLDVAGEALATRFTGPSDKRLKTNITQLTNILEKLQKIRGISFDWNELCKSLGRSTGRREIGIIAQEVEAVFPELVTTWGDEKYRAIDYGRLTAVLVEAVKELKAENETLKQRIEALENAPREKEIKKPGTPKRVKPEAGRQPASESNVTSK